MKIHKTAFLISYVIYMIFAIFYTIWGSLHCADALLCIETLVFAVSISGCFFAMADVVLTKYDIDSKERDKYLALILLSRYAQKIYLKKLEGKYASVASKKMSELKDKYGIDLADERFYEGLSEEEKQNLIKKIDDVDLKGFFSLMTQTIENKSEDDFEEEDESVNDVELYKGINYFEKKNFKIACILEICGLVILLIILTLRIEPNTLISNISTLSAFLFVMVNILIKEYYRDKVLKELDKKEREVIGEIKEILKK